MNKLFHIVVINIASALLPTWTPTTTIAIHTARCKESLQSIDFNACFRFAGSSWTSFIRSIFRIVVSCCWARNKKKNMIEQGFPEVYIEHTLGCSFLKNTISKWRYKTCFNLTTLSSMFVYSNNCGKHGTVQVREIMLINIRWEKHTNITFRCSVNRLSCILFETPK